MGRYVRVFALVFLAAALAACGYAEPDGALPVAVQASVAQDAAPAVVAVREVVEADMPAAPAHAPPIDARAISLIVRYEITSPSYYVAHLQAPVWPGEQSGVTWGIGYDGGQQTRTRIAEDWHAHPQVLRLVATSGVVGPPARALLPGLRDVLTPYPLAEAIFAEATLPAYHALSARTFRKGWDNLRPTAQGALTATVYNRGAGMSGDRRREMRALRDDCVPRQDYACMASQFRAMERLWIGTPIAVGMRDRYEATARLAEVQQ